MTVIGNRTQTIRVLSTHILTRRMTLSGYAGNLDLDLSTHILTRRMTGAGAYWDLQTNPFNSHPHKEDDMVKAEKKGRSTSFNSHPHKEDDYKATDKQKAEILSTHILTRRMTGPSLTYPSVVMIFQLTSSQGG